MVSGVREAKRSCSETHSLYPVSAVDTAVQQASRGSRTRTDGGLSRSPG